MARGNSALIRGNKSRITSAQNSIESLEKQLERENERHATRVGDLTQQIETLRNRMEEDKAQIVEWEAAGKKADDATGAEG